MDVIMQHPRKISNICQHHKFGYCKFAQLCRKYHVQEICLESDCDHQNCLKRHPKLCRTFSIHQRCKFGEYCAFKHSENSQKKEINNLKEKVNSLEIKDCEKSKEISDLNNRLEMLYATVEQIVADREDMFREAAKSAQTTPTIKTKKRRKAKQHPSPSPTHQHPGLHQPVKRTDHQHQQGDGQVSPAHHSDDDDEKVLTAEEIAKLYEEDEEDPDEN